METGEAQTMDTLADTIVQNTEHVLAGEKKATEMALTVWLSEGNMLGENIPGSGKTILANEINRVAPKLSSRRETDD